MSRKVTASPVHPSSGSIGLVAVGSIALDTIETPSGRRDDALGGSAIYFSWAARLFTKVALVGVVGRDFPAKHLKLIRSKGIDTAGVEVMDGATFRWHGRYHRDMNVRDTVQVQLNVFGDFKPRVPEQHRGARYAFLANGRPAVQGSVLAQMVRPRDAMRRPRFVMADTMNHWIRDNNAELKRILRRVDGLLVNDEEARLLTGEDNLLKAGRRILKLGPKAVIVKKGEHGSLIFADSQCAALPAYPTERVVDPTGAGDSFAGGLMGYLAEADKVSGDTLMRAAAYGTVIASFTVEDFGLAGLSRATRKDVDARLERYRRKLRV